MLLTLVEREQPDAARHGGGDRRDGVTRLFPPFDVQPFMHFQHEFVEMDATLVRDGDRVEEQVHQHRLAPPDRAPDVEPLRNNRLAAAEQAFEKAGRVGGFQLGRQLVEPLGGVMLFGVGA